MYIVNEHPLMIERGRYFKIPREERICTFCKEIEDEKHFLLHCTKNSDIRKDFFQNLAQKDFNNITDNNKLKILLNPETISQLKSTVSYIKQSLELRMGD